MTDAAIAPNTHVAGSAPADFLVLEHLCRRYGDAITAVADLNLSLKKGEMLGLLGPSGCGKTTALRMIAGLLTPTQGTIRLAGEDITARPPHRRDIGLVFQSYALFPHMSVAQNVAFGLKMRGVDKSASQDRVMRALEMVRMAHLAARKPRELSGGQQQRVALARALVIEPRLLLLDEPLSNLDAKLRDEMRYEIREIQQRLGITTVLVTHDQVEALTMCDQVAVMNTGNLAQIGPPEDIYEKPTSLFVSNFVGRSNLLDCEPQGPRTVRIGEHIFRTASDQLPAGPAVASIRPHRLTLTPARDTALVSSAMNCVSGRINRVTYIGEIVEYVVSAAGMTLQVEMPTRSQGALHRTGDTILCEWDPADMWVFAKD